MHYHLTAISIYSWNWNVVSVLHHRCCLFDHHHYHHHVWSMISMSVGSFDHRCDGFANNSSNFVNENGCVNGFDSGYAIVTANYADDNSCKISIKNFTFSMQFSEKGHKQKTTITITTEKRPKFLSLQPESSDYQIIAFCYRGKKIHTKKKQIVEIN